MASFELPDWALLNQRKASQPAHSAWVSANAGSGKTHVLASRVIRLLLGGVAPSKILCLTFTKAAAANMAARVFDILAKWTQISDLDLRREIREISGETPSGAKLVEARKLFARAVETPGGLKIQTIHAFCERLLHLFPFEANAPSHFEIADDLRQAELLAAARRQVFAAAQRDGVVGAAIERVALECGEAEFEELINEAMRHEAVFRAASPQELIEALRRSLGIAEGRGTADAEREITEGGIPPERWSGIADLLDKGSSADQKQSVRLRRALADLDSLSFGHPFEKFLQSYCSIFFTKDKERKVKDRESLLTKPLATLYPDLDAELKAERQRLAQLCEERKALLILERSRALIAIAGAIFERYRTNKAAHAILDFGDLIERTLTLLQRSDASWVHFKLDAGIDHILVDEAQDTSKAQWQILDKLTAEFSSGLGQTEGPRTFFAVGDEKQSIFSFQGAAPRMFDEMRRGFARRFAKAKQGFAHVQLNLSFRSAPGILSAIDRVFAQGDHMKGLVAQCGDWAEHEAYKRDLPALIELWPATEPAETQHPEEWKLPVDYPRSHDPANILANRIAQKIKELLDPRSGECVHDKGHCPRPVRSGDILILVRKRGALFDAIIRALRTEGIPTAGADRLDLMDHIAVMDLIAAGRASLLPEDDLTLACVLKSPLIGLNDDDLLAFAPSRQGSLIEALQASPGPRHREAAAKLARWRALAGGSAFQFYATLLGREGGRAGLESRLGAEARDAIGEFLRLALRHEEMNTPSLANFLNSLSGLDYSVKREMEAPGDAVRVMTVHAAKGLEAKIVFLPDTSTVPSHRHDPELFVLAPDSSGAQAIAWSPNKDLDCKTVAAARVTAREAAMEEYRRLLYVALSRAEEKLYIAACHGKNGPERGSWAAMIEAAFQDDPRIEEAPAPWNGSERVRRIVSGRLPAAGLASVNTGQAQTPIAVPEWLCRPAPGRHLAPLLRPSQALARENAPRGRVSRSGRRQALQRGSLIHGLLQHLPGIPEAQRPAAAHAFLLSLAPGLDESARQAIAAEAAAVMALPGLAPLFGPGSRAEVCVIGSVPAGDILIPVKGRIDRLVETNSEIIAADFKTGEPCGLDAVPASYVAQMALYRAVLAPLWPVKSLRLALIWTEAAEALWLPEGKLDAALAAFAKS